MMSMSMRMRMRIVSQWCIVIKTERIFVKILESESGSISSDNEYVSIKVINKAEEIYSLFFLHAVFTW